MEIHNSARRESTEGGHEAAEAKGEINARQ
jgi:hypothetical protein